MFAVSYSRQFQNLQFLKCTANKSGIKRIEKQCNPHIRVKQTCMTQRYKKKRYLALSFLPINKR